MSHVLITRQASDREEGAHFRGCPPPTLLLLLRLLRLLLLLLLLRLRLLLLLLQSRSVSGASACCGVPSGGPSSSRHCLLSWWKTVRPVRCGCTYAHGTQYRQSILILDTLCLAPFPLPPHPPLQNSPPLPKTQHTHRPLDPLSDPLPPPPPKQNTPPCRLIMSAAASCQTAAAGWLTCGARLLTWHSQSNPTPCARGWGHARQAGGQVRSGWIPQKGSRRVVSESVVVSWVWSLASTPNTNTRMHASRAAAMHASGCAQVLLRKGTNLQVIEN